MLVLGILWRKSFGQNCKIVACHDERIMQLELSISGNLYNLYNAYLPCDNGSNIEEYREYLTRIIGLLDLNPLSFIFGDLNANPLSSTHRFGKELLKFCNSEKVILSDIVKCSQDTFTFLSEAHGSVAWLDHIISTHTLHSLIKRIWVEYGYVSSDHFPINVELNIPTNRTFSKKQRVTKQDIKVNWSKVLEADRRNYEAISKQKLSAVELDNNMILCEDQNCSDPGHVRGIDKLYNDICDALHASSEQLKNQMETKTNHRAGWNSICADLHATAREAFLLWRSHGKPRFGPVFEIMRRSRSNFKSALRKCKDLASQKQADNLASKLINSKDKDFWREIKKVNSQSKVTTVTETIEKCSGEENIAEMWRKHFNDILNAAPQQEPPCLHTHHSSESEFTRFSPMEVEKALQKLKVGKSPGTDNVQAEHLKLAHKGISVLLGILFNCMIIHNHLPEGFMSTIIIPIVKDCKGDLSSKDNYRPVALTSVISKVLEMIILSRYSENMTTTCNQFGFKPKHGTEECIFALQQITDFYITNSSPIYLCFIDLSKAFDRVNHSLLFDKLMQIGVHHLVVRLLATWYRTQSFQVRWGTALSVPFPVSNGVRQGSILSPSLFNVFINDLSSMLQSLNYGCHLNNTCFNHLIYADDTVLIAPSPGALQKLIHVCNDYIKSHSLVLNVKKTKCMMLTPKIFRNITFPTMYIDNNPIKVVTEEKYLGYHIRSDCTDDAAMLNALKGVYSRGNMLVRNFKMCDLNVKIKLFQTFCSSFYCCSLWSDSKKSTLEKLKVGYNNVFRSLLNLDRRISMSQTFVQFNVHSFPVLHRKLIYSLYQRVVTSENSIIREIVNSAHFHESSLYKFWLDKLFTY